MRIRPETGGNWNRPHRTAAVNHWSRRLPKEGRQNSRLLMNKRGQREGRSRNRNRPHRTAAVNHRGRMPGRTRHLPENRPRSPGRKAPVKKNRRPTGSNRMKAKRQNPSPKRPEGKRRLSGRTRPADRKRMTVDSRSPGKGAAAGRRSCRNRRISRGSHGGGKGRIRTPVWKRTAGTATRNRPNRNRLPMMTDPQTARMGGITIEGDRSI